MQKLWWEAHGLQVLGTTRQRKQKTRELDVPKEQRASEHFAHARSAGPNVELLLNTMDDSLATFPNDEDLWIGDSSNCAHDTEGRWDEQMSLSETEK
jgi:hypothetical protein